MFYTITDYANIISFVNLPETTISAIAELDRLQGSVQPRSNPNTTFYAKKLPNNTTKQGGAIGFKNIKTLQNGRKDFKPDGNSQWEKIEKLKATIIVKKEGIEKIINDIRASINKLSATNYDKQFALIMDYIENTQKEPIVSVDEDDDDDEPVPQVMDTRKEDLYVISTAIFDIIIQNQGLFNNASLLVTYIKLFISLNDKYPIFTNILNDFINNFETILNVENTYYDPNTHYDEFCKYNKLNEIHKSNTAFICALFKSNVLYLDNIYDIFLHLRARFDVLVDTENKKNELEQVAENIKILIMKTHDQLSTHPQWAISILPFLEETSKKKGNSQVSLSHKIVFTFKDIIDAIHK